MLFRLAAVESVCKLLGALAGPSLLSKSKWLPFYVGIPVLVLSIPIALALPETLKSGVPSTTTESTEASPHEPGSSNYAASSDPPSKGAFFNMRSIANKLVISAIMYVYFARILEAYTIGSVIQYVSKQFHLSLAQAGFFLPSYSAGKLLTFAVILPHLTAYLRRRMKSRAFSVDLLILKCSICLLALGQVIIGLSPVWPVVVCGEWPPVN